MKKLAILVSLIIGMSAQAAFGQGSNIVKADLNQAEIDNIVKTFTANEGRFREALASYVFNRSATIQTIGMGGQVTGQYRRDSFMTFGREGSRFEKITYAPVSTIKELEITPEDIEDLGGINAFALEPRFAQYYNFTYLGKEKIDELNLHVFEVAPKVMPDPKKSKLRLFLGRVWVDDRDLLIVKSKGKAVPEGKKSRFPVVETLRENVDGKYWFPAYAVSDDQLEFDNGYVVHFRMKVTYKDYTEGKTEVTIVGEEDVPSEPKAKPTPTPKKP